MMTDFNPDDLRRIFDLAFDAPLKERTEILQRECGGDIELQRRVEAMIAAAQDTRFLNAATLNSAKPASASAAEQPGTRIGPYKLLQQIGEGGFGLVFMAEQEKPVQRKVALKIIKLGMDTRQVVARFEQERQALALMDHPHVARVFDAGSTETGRPFFVMELCTGEAITSYCDKHNLSILQRLNLFVQICQAVQHAHQKGLIHRDIKPSNVLVSTQDSKPFAKIIDFGVAKATASRLTEKTLFTEHKQIIGTPEYMSPEQAEGSLDIDTRTDVYSLGVLLYELLTGSTPFDSRSLRSAAFGEIQRIIREVEPPKPSTRLAQSSDTIASVAARRDTEPKKLGTLVRGELDWIVMKALEKDRQRRYESANALGVDIQRYLSGEAVVAAPPSRAYIARKFVRRNKGPVSAVAAVMVALLIGAVAFAWQAREARRERDKAIAARAEAEQKQLLAETVNAFFSDQILSRGNPDRTDQGAVATLKEAIDLAAKKLETLFADEPIIRATIHEAIGQAYRGMGLWKEAEYHFRAAFDRRRSARGPDDVDTLKLMHRLATVYRITGDDRAEPMLRELLDRRAKVLGPENPATCNAKVALGMLLVGQRRNADALPLLEAGYAGQVKSKGERDIDSIQTLGAISMAYQGSGQSEKATQIVEKQLRLATETLPPDHPEITRAQGALAGQYARAGRVAEAIELFRAADESEKRRLGEDHPNRLSSYTDLAGGLARNKQFDEAIRIFQDAIRIGSSSPRVDPGTLANLKAKYAGTLVAAQRYEEAEAILLEAYPVVLKQFGPKHYRTQNTASTIVKLYDMWGKPDKAAAFRASTQPATSQPTP